MDEEAIAQLVSVLKGFKPGRPLKSYIAYAVFPKFKHIEAGTRVDFPFPLTALVGPNGCGKSSLLHALYGMPHRSSTIRFWFATALDPIAGPKKDPQRYFYGHWNESFDGIVETRKARLGTKPDYWEPYRLSTADGMQKLPDGQYNGKAADRWNPVRRKVTYVNLKATIGSFDRYFHFDDFENNDQLRTAMQREAKRLQRIKETNRQSYILGNEKLFENRDLKPDELQAVSAVLGRRYDSARVIRHSLYPGTRGKDMSVVFRRGREYSEAFAGSGELAAVRVVTDVLAAEEYSLILLDEPETSLHPGAQRALLRFLLEQIKTKKHQVVLSTHSRDFLDGLPQNAIKVFEDNGDGSGSARILPRSTPAAALLRLGRVPADKIRILVEDELARLLILHAAKNLDAGDAARLEVNLSPGGWSHMLAYSGPSHMASGQPIYIYIDGDQKKVEAFTDPDTIAPAQYGELAEKLKAELGTEPKFSRPGGLAEAVNEAAAVRMRLQYLKWLRKHVAYLPRKRPEEIPLAALRPGTDYSALNQHACKEAFRQLLTDGADVQPGSAADEAAWAKLKVAKLPLDNEDVIAISQQLGVWLEV
jgi:energy-coupling factor transporter ATP-binding protein EcfA2